MTKRFCTECGSPLPEGSKFCTDCGTAVKGAASEKPPSKAPASKATLPKAVPTSRPAPANRSQTNWPLWAGGGLVIVLIVAAAVLFWPGEEPVQTVATPPAVSEEASEIPYPDVVRVTPEEVKAGFDAGEILFVDVRDEASYVRGHVAGAIHIPPDAFEAGPVNLPMDQEIVTYCT